MVVRTLEWVVFTWTRSSTSCGARYSASCLVRSRRTLPTPASNDRLANLSGTINSRLCTAARVCGTLIQDRYVQDERYTAGAGRADAVHFRFARRVWMSRPSLDGRIHSESWSKVLHGLGAHTEFEVISSHDFRQTLRLESCFITISSFPGTWLMICVSLAVPGSWNYPGRHASLSTSNKQ